MALAVVISPNGIPVSAAPSPYGLPVIVATNGYGLAVTPVASGGRPVFDTGGTLFGPAVIPANTSPPVITGTTQVGSTLLTSSGTWSGSAASYTFQWKRGGVAISGATSSIYTLVSADVTTMITVTVTATNTAGNASATSAARGPVTAVPIIMQAGTGAFVFTGEDMTPIAGYLMQAGANAFLLAGQSADLKYVGSDAAETTAFLARADAISVVGAPERAAYTALINGLVADGVLAQMDVLYVFATDTIQHAALNLVQTGYTGTLYDAGGSATLNFTPHRGLASPDGAAVISNFNPTTASSPKYTQNSAHYSFWSNTAGAEGKTCLGNDPASTHLHPSFAGDCYMRINDASSSGVAFSGAGGDGLYIASRTSASNRDCYYKGVSQGNANSATSTAPTNDSLWALASPGAPGSTKQGSAASFGGKLTPTQAASLYTRLRAYMTAVGVP